MSKRKNERQRGSLKLWRTDESGLFWEKVMVHSGRITIPITGPEASDAEVAHELMKTHLKRRKSKVR